MGDSLGEGAWSMRIQYKPLVRYIWLGAVVMALGGMIAATDRRYRGKVTAEAAQTIGSPPPAPPDLLPPQTDSV
jgi:cytochrome c-type biogenesis protein CcmF